MNKLRSMMTLLAAIMLLASCGSGGGKFTGEWKQAGDKDETPKILVIEKADGHYAAYNKKTPDRKMSFDYDDKKDCLRGDLDGKVGLFTYNKENGHITLAPEKAGMYEDAMEFEKAK